MKSNRRIMVDSNGKVATEQNPAVTYRLLVAEGGQIFEADMQKHGLTVADLGIGEGASEQLPPDDNVKPVSDFKALSQQAIAPEVKGGGGAVESKPSGLIIEKAPEPDKALGVKKAK